MLVKHLISTQRFYLGGIIVNKINQVQEFLVENNIDAAFVTTPDNVFYFSGFDSNPHERLLGVMVFKEAEPFIICPKMEIPDALASGWSFEAVGHTDTDNAWDIVAATVAKRDIKIETMAIEKAHLTVEKQIKNSLLR